MKTEYPKEVNDMVRQLYGNHDCPNDYKKVADLNDEDFRLMKLYIADRLEDLPEYLDTMFFK